jgi:cobaltochelatase CobN
LFFRQENPFALQEITAVMLETVRKGMWKASEQQISDIAVLHTELVKEYGSSGNGFAGGNIKLQDFIAGKISPDAANEYKKQIRQMRTGASSDAGDNKGTILKKDEINPGEKSEKNSLNGMVIVSVILVAFIVLLLIVRKKRK